MADEKSVISREGIIAQIQQVQDELKERGVRREYTTGELLRKSDDQLKDLLEAKTEQLKTRKKWLGEKST